MIDPTDLPSPVVFGFPFTDWPGPASAITIGTAGQARYRRVIEGGRISKIGMQVATSSGNVSVAVFQNTGTGRTSKPGVLLASSAAVACPATGYGEVALDGPVTLKAGDWLALSCDSATATFYGQSGLGATALYSGMAGGKISEHPIATASPTITYETNRLINLIGVA